MDSWKIRNKEEEYQVSFSNDIVEKCLGQYYRLKKKMKEIEPGCPNWVIQSDMKIDHPVGIFVFVINFYHDGSAVIYNTSISKMQGHHINDVRFLKKAILWMGWKSLTCTPAEIESSIDFWKRCWETGLIDSHYLSMRFKKRE
jgi:hypothetical protein